MKCVYKHCLHDSKEIEEGEGVKVGSRYMHNDCARYSKAIKDIVLYYKVHLSSDVVQAALNKVINDIVFEKRNDPEDVLYALKEAVRTGIKIKTPFGLYYVIDSEPIRRSWVRKNAIKIVKNMKPVEKKEEADFKYTPDPVITLISVVR